MRTLDSSTVQRFERTSDITGASRGVLTWLVLTLFALSFAGLAVAPYLLPDSYSWVAHTVSESGGQGVETAWVVRVGVVVSAFASFLLVALAGRRWPTGSRMWIRFYSVALLGVGLLADGPWHDGPYNETEAFLHTFSAFWAAVGFALGVLLLSRRRSSGGRWVRAYDRVVVVATATIPGLMLIVEPYAGLLQRALAVLGYGWLFMEAWRVGSKVDGPLPSARIL